MKVGFGGLCIVFFILLSGCGPSQPEREEASSVDPAAVRLLELNKAIKANDRNPDLYHERAAFFLHDREFNKALNDINKAITLDDKNPAFYITLSDIQLLMGQSDNCMTALTKAIVLDPDNQEARLKLAQLYLILRNYSATYQVVNEIIAMDDYNPRAYFLRAIARLENGDTARAVGDLMKAVDQDQLYFDAYMQLGELFSIRKDPLAEGYLINALRVKPDNKEAMYMLGMYYQSREQWEQALQTYERLCIVAPDFSYAPFNKGYIYLVYFADFPKAIDAFTDAIRIDSAYADAFFNRGYAYELSDQPDLAYDDYKTTLKLKVNYPGAINGLNRLDQVGYVR